MIPEILDVVSVSWVVRVDQNAFNVVDALLSDFPAVYCDYAVTYVELVPRVLLDKCGVASLVVRLGKALAYPLVVCLADVECFGIALPVASRD